MYRIMGIIRKWVATTMAVMAVWLVGCAQSSLTPHPLENELRSSIEQYFQVISNAELSYDTAQLFDVATETWATELEQGIKAREEAGVVASEERKIDELRVLENTNTISVVEVKYQYRPFTLDHESGERLYNSVLPDNWDWRREEITLVKKNDRWIVQVAKHISWSG